MRYYFVFRNHDRVRYKPDFRQQIADSWPDSLDDTYAQEQWDWKAKFGKINI